MESDTIKLIDVLAKNGPGFLLAGILLVLYYYDKKAWNRSLKYERDRSEEMAKALLTISSDSIKVDTEHTAAIQALTKVLDSIDRRIQK